MVTYHSAQICLNGHMVNSSFDLSPESSHPFCSKCGSRTITSCPSCGAKLHGKRDYGYVVITNSNPVESYCYNCGNPYPWTESAISSISLLIQEEDELSDQLKSSIIASLPDVISETPKTNLAVVRFKKCFTVAGKFTTDALRQFAIDFGCELFLKSLGL